MTAHAVEGDGPLLDGPLLDDSASAGGAFIGAEFVGAEVGSPGVAAAIDALGLAGLLAARSEARRLVEDDGITYGVGARARTWTIDPLPLVIGTDEWTRLEAGLRQRALVLDLVLTDLYGERRLLRKRLLPPELVLGHPGFLPQVDGIRLPGDRQLIQVATDLVRDDTGEPVAGARVDPGSIAGEIDADQAHVSGQVVDATVIRARSLDVKLESDGKMTVTFGRARLEVGDAPEPP